ncbi:hypothetical protein ACA30_10665 [Virgibacillus soli]|uniref:Uncharacterized protein n=1 Tax=Lederbergia galactosidilytica TaxID=217031 RepID=A0A178A2A8_9BACI|nr:hypothetical protein ACA30_10665 [Virgibacillus soli]OAK74242.1 hypothetical protein ABB05_05000 [Lederbergia galactosidilytica]
MPLRPAFCRPPINMALRDGGSFPRYEVTPHAQVRWLAFPLLRAAPLRTFDVQGVLTSVGIAGGTTLLLT